MPSYDPVLCILLACFFALVGVAGAELADHLADPRRKRRKED